MNNIEIARKWRIARGYTGKGGVVVLFQGEIQGWVNELRNPEHWQAGCIAVDEDGQSWVTVGGLVGTQHDAANEWRLLT